MGGFDLVGAVAWFRCLLLGCGGCFEDFALDCDEWFLLGLCMVTVAFAWWLSFSGGMFGVSVLLIGLWVLDFWLWLIWFDGLA